MSAVRLPWKVLFCGHMMQSAFRLTRDLVHKSALTDIFHIVDCSSADLPVAIRDADVAVPLMSALDASLIESAQRLKMIIQFGVGVEGVDIAAASKKGVMVSNMASGSTGNALSCAEHAIFLALALLRDLPACQAAVATGRLGEPTGETLFGKSTLVLGFGGIARELIPRLAVFGARVSCIRRGEWSAEDEALPAARVLEGRGSREALPEMLPRADIIFVTASQTPESRGLINAEFLKRCRRGVRIVNVARGGLVERDAVAAALESGHVGGLGLDVTWREPVPPDDPLLSHPKVLVTPHIAGVTDLSYSDMARVLVDTCVKVKDGGVPAVLLNCKSFVPPTVSS